MLDSSSRVVGAEIEEVVGDVEKRQWSDTRTSKIVEALPDKAWVDEA